MVAIANVPYQRSAASISAKKKKDARFDKERKAVNPAKSVTWAPNKVYDIFSKLGLNPYKDLTRDTTPEDYEANIKRQAIAILMNPNNYSHPQYGGWLIDFTDRHGLEKAPDNITKSSPPIPLF